jgi:hypothetical protein
LFDKGLLGFIGTSLDGGEIDHVFTTFILAGPLSGRDVIARDLEQHWVALMRRNAEPISEQAGLFAGKMMIEQANAMQPRGLKVKADCVICSPPYLLVDYQQHIINVPSAVTLG